MRTYSAKKEEVIRQWYAVDAAEQSVGRLASRIALYLRGKHKPEYTPHVDTGDYIVVTNVEKLRVTGKKYTDKIYHHHTGYPGGIRSVSFKHLQEKYPERILEKAVRGMLPKNSLGRQMLKKLKLVVGPEHPYKAQQPKSLLLTKEKVSATDGE